MLMEQKDVNLKESVLLAVQNGFINTYRTMWRLRNKTSEDGLMRRFLNSVMELDGKVIATFGYWIMDTNPKDGFSIEVIVTDEREDSPFAGEGMTFHRMGRSL